MGAFFAHSENERGIKHDLVQHLEAVAGRASDLGQKFGAGELAQWAGLWHDLGKFHPDFQAYLRNPEAGRGPDHSSAGMVYAIRHWDGLGYLVGGHHAGLASRTGLKNRLRDKQESPAVKEAIEIAAKAVTPLAPEGRLNERLPAVLKAKTGVDEHQQRQTELFLRFAFSALVDADFLDTELHFQSARAEQRGGAPSLENLWKRFESNQAGISGRASSRLNEIRHEIYLSCLHAADLPQGLFRLTVPTGGGKTRSGVGFALRHAIRHGLDRVIVAIPYTSIIDQTAKVYREIFGNEAVLEHHSAIGGSAENANPVTYDQVWGPLGVRKLGRAFRRHDYRSTFRELICESSVLVSQVA
jgi:CRISPR-associated endonuclease/helicase Cas3